MRMMARLLQWRERFEKLARLHIFASNLKLFGRASGAACCVASISIPHHQWLLGGTGSEGEREREDWDRSGLGHFHG